MDNIGETISLGWQRLLKDIELAGHYPPLNTTDLRTIQRTLALENMIPSLLYLKMCSLLDEGLIGYLDINTILIPKSYKNSLFGRIEYLCDEGILEERDDLHFIRGTRNDLAHSTTSRLNSGFHCLRDSLDCVQRALSTLGFDVGYVHNEFFEE